jgi:uncharacterized protein (UPF0303 family)
MTATDDLARINEQERRLRFDRFDETTAWELGSLLRRLAAGRGLAVAIEVRLARDTVFFSAMPGTAPANADWARRKHNTVELLGRSSYGVGRSMELEGTTLEAKLGLPLRDYASHGGGFPLRAGGILVGAVMVSGLPQRQDHALVVEALASLCGVPLAEVALGEP